MWQLVFHKRSRGSGGCEWPGDGTPGERALNRETERLTAIPYKSTTASATVNCLVKKRVASPPAFYAGDRSAACRAERAPLGGGQATGAL